MTASYRPVKPKEAWHSLLASDMTISERYCQLYLLTSPHANTIGCYPLVMKIAAAEAGLSTEELGNVLERLEVQDVVYYRSGFVLVRTWFLHSTWESTFTGNVLKAASREAAALPMAIQQLWIDACIQAGVPHNILENVLAKSLASPSKGAGKGLPDNNNNETEQVTRNTTTNEPDRQCCGGDQIYLLPIAEVHRHAVEMLNASHKLQSIQIQEIGYELSQRLEDEASGRGKPIARVIPWLKKLADMAAGGQRVLDRGSSLALKHQAEIHQEQNLLISAESEREADAAASAQRAYIAKFLLDLPEPELMAFADFAVLPSTSTNLTCKIRDSIRAAVRTRKLPLGPSREAIVKAGLQWMMRQEQQE